MNQAKEARFVEQVPPLCPLWSAAPMRRQLLPHGPALLNDSDTPTSPSKHSPIPIPHLQSIDGSRQRLGMESLDLVQVWHGACCLLPAAAGTHPALIPLFSPVSLQFYWHDYSNKNYVAAAQNLAALQVRRMGGAGSGCRRRVGCSWPCWLRLCTLTKFALPPYGMAPPPSDLLLYPPLHTCCCRRRAR